LVYWQANKYYRQKCVKRILQFNPLLAGDKYWKDVFRNEKFEYHPPIGYGEELFKLYALSTVNFASSSVQMAGAVTQRVFDVPAAGGFVLTDRREQLQEMFEVGREVICYENLEQIKELIERYLFEDRERVKIIKAARRRIAAEHTYTQRLQTLLSTALQSV
jgi:spore maturation protein CgeB